MSDEDLADLPASRAIHMFRQGKLSPVELTEAVIARSETVNPKVNAYTYTFYDRAVAAAGRAERRYRNGTQRPLEGVPIVIKDLHPIKGEITTYGSKLFARSRDTETHPGVSRLLDAGAILLARSTSPEFGLEQVCATELWGVTRNPWNLACSPGASSAGAAAAVASGMTTLADGSDYGGSIRIPAAFCGTFGYMAPYGRNPETSPSNLDSYSHHGPITRTVADAALMQNVLSGLHPRDISTLRERVVIPGRLPGIKGWRVAYSMDLGYYDVDPEVVQAMKSALAALREVGCRVEAVKLGWSLSALAAFEIHAGWAMAAGKAKTVWKKRHRVADIVRRRLEWGMTLKPEDVDYANRVQCDMYARLGPILAKHDVFVCPSAPLTSVPAEKPAAEWGTLRIDGRRIMAHNQATMTYPFNMLGQLPVASVPAGFAKNGVPIGVQIVGRSFDDLGVFRTAAAYERVRPWLHRPSARPHLD